MTLPYQGTEPTRAHHDDAGLDLTAAETITIPHGQRRTVRLGTAVAIPTGHVGLLCPRSGLAAKHGITTLTAPGIIDAGYRGELRIVLYNTDPNPYTIHKGDRIAQLVITPYTHLTPTPQPLTTTTRGNQGFGSTDTHANK